MQASTSAHYKLPLSAAVRATNRSQQIIGSLSQGETCGVVRVSSPSLWHLRRRRRQAGAPADQQDAGDDQRHDHERLVRRIPARQRARRDACLRSVCQDVARLFARSAS